MATPTEFPEQNTVLKAAPGTESWVRDLPIYRQYADGVNDQCVVSCWTLSPEELAEIARTGKVYFQCFGLTHPPVSIWGTSPFRQPEPAPAPVAEPFDNEGWHTVTKDSYATPKEDIEVECQYQDHSGNVITTRGFCSVKGIWDLPDVEGQWPILRWRFKS